MGSVRCPHQTKTPAGLRRRTYLYDGQFDKAIAVLEKALAMFESLGHLPGQASVYSRLAPAYAEAYNLGPALSCDRRALSLYSQINNQTRLGIAHHNLAETYVLLGAYKQAREHTLKSLEISRQQSRKINADSIGFCGFGRQRCLYPTFARR